MGKASHKNKTSMKSKQKLQIHDCNKYLKPGALAQLCNSKASALVSMSCLDLGKKRVAVLDAEEAGCNLLCQNKSGDDSPIISSPERLRVGYADEPVDSLKENSLQRTPRPDEGKADYESRLESLPMEMLVKILCHLHHDQLRAVFHVSERIRTAVIIARKFHFNYTTPDRSRQEMLNMMTPLPTQHWPFVSKEDEKKKALTLPRTPKAPRHGARPPSRYKLIEMRQVAAVLFQESSFSPKYIVPSVLPKPICKAIPSNRVLFDEELELCQAVAQNKLR
ncbi:putative F-box domain-containing protein [Helianthus annuus]|uniref:F-box domain-containing protein n=1 Tax=Helianthus annuus TaxID=4232 RepID=A0A251SC18_HELAN|nr:F-box protein At4g35930 [Helianthus annuus]KAF5765884.1 putative F-box domain-containing protein [Helianthus annuus]KAJ0474250.1 putative F-box domain-containing protein [Helianthus annuus]KAJ0649820.1 putative F-box domain-containing protein [Helianthus annuus]KAJ0653601.1 putative F-box domain-containing protein [Helianthus annuus]KAJ0832582.1 putative F-box domain-containing protein [Helianthus annuus]